MTEYEHKCKEHGWEGHEECPFCLGERIAEANVQADKVRWEYEQGFDAPEHDPAPTGLAKENEK